MSSDDIKDISKRLDGLVVDVFSTLEELLAAKSQLETAMKDGYLFMAKARNVMGGSSSVSSMQYCTEDLNHARVHVDIIPNQSQDTLQSTSDQSEDSFQAVAEDASDAVDFRFIPSRNFSIQSFDHSKEARFDDARECPSTTDVIGGGISLGLRKRATTVKTEEQQTNGTDIDQPISADKHIKNKTKNKESSVEASSPVQASKEVSPVQASKEVLSSYKDPLLWFGVLVPQSLRSSQASFVRAVELSLTVATLQAKLCEQHRVFTQNMNVKTDLLLRSTAAPTLSDDTDAHCTDSDVLGGDVKIIDQNTQLVV